ncbi:MAG: hypothetical protein F6K24_49325, partial [Okeania sp. SIO2D1]|nr:hypothetical protein [Okeania sp. SIO2D1]
HCTLLITSTEKNANLYLYAKTNNRRSRMFEAGQEYLAATVQLGVYGGRSASNNLLKDVPIKASITFDRVSLEVNKIQIIQMSVSSDSGKIPLEFRDVPLSQ